MKHTALLLIWAALLSCGTKKSEQQDVTDAHGQTSENVTQLGIEADSILIPPFEIEVALTDKAKARMGNPKESIIVLVEFTGEPTDTVMSGSDDVGPFVMRSIECEISAPWTLKVENIKMSKNIFNMLKDKNYEVSAQIWTGRHSSDDNLLQSNMVYGTIEEIKNKKHKIIAKLITE